MKTFFKLLLIVYLLICIYLIITQGFKKTWALVKFSIVHIFITPFHLLSPFIIIGYWIDKIPFVRYLVWLIMDYSRLDKTTKSGYAPDYWIYIQDRGKTKETWWIAIQWHFKRNRVANLINLFKVPNSEKWIKGKLIGNNFIGKVEFAIDKLYKNNKNKTKIVQDGNWVTMAGLKYIPKHKDDDIYQVNQGDIISIKTSILGTGLIWYNIGNWFSFRYSQCKIVKYPFFSERYRTIKLGTNSNRYPLTIKHQKVKEWK